ncbi:hypothetical protein HK098_002753 [Nowakowskiella sp. JEL0407]|nr:hypothetical protein HK098_002753 [Nowakowskiella sp. JEL0407]
MTSHCRVIQVGEVANPFVNELREEITKFDEPPLLVAFLSNNDPAARKYAEWTEKSCAATGIRFKLVEVPRTELEEKICEANEDKNVHGIMVYYPVFGDQQDQYLMNTVSVYKDVEGLCHTYRHHMYRNVRYLDKEETQKCIIPCTPLAMIKILEYISVYNKILAYGNRLHGKTITVINRSEVVGRPLAALLANDGAKVYSVDVTGILEFHRGAGISLCRHEVFETSVTLEEALKVSDVVISGVPSPNYKVKTENLKEGVVAINFASAKNFEENVKERASIYVHNVGKVTVTMLQRNLMRLWSYQKQNEKK